MFCIPWYNCISILKQKADIKRRSLKHWVRVILGCPVYKEDFSLLVKYWFILPKGCYFFLELRGTFSASRTRIRASNGHQRAITHLISSWFFATLYQTSSFLSLKLWSYFFISFDAPPVAYICKKKWSIAKWQLYFYFMTTLWELGKCLWPWQPNHLILDSVNVE